MSKSKEAREARRLALHHYKANPPQPLRVVPSKRGLVTIFVLTGILGYGSGLGLEVLHKLLGAK